MSARDQNIEQSHAADDPATSTPPSTPRRDPVEDADPSFTRKRPRLDDGGASLRAISTDSDSPSKVMTSPHKEMVAMTIREHPASSPPPADDEEHNHIATGYSTDQASTPTMLPAMLDGTEDDPASPPVIEIIDDDDEPATSFMVQLNAEDYFRQFPYQGRFRSYSEALREIQKHVQNSKSRQYSLFATELC
jgi:ubiquitin carboxyl-terminal hydrolase 34